MPQHFLKDHYLRVTAYGYGDQNHKKASQMRGFIKYISFKLTSLRS